MRGACWFGALLVAATTALAVRRLPRQADAQPQPVGLFGALLVDTGMVALLLAVSQGERWAWSSPAVLSLAAAGVALIAGWVARTARVTRRGGSPWSTMWLAVGPGLRGQNAVTVVLAVAMYGLLTIVVLLVRNGGSAGWGLGLGVLAAGFVLVPYSLTSVVGSRVAIRLPRRFRAHVLLPAGRTIFGSAMVVLAFAHDHFWQALLVMAVGASAAASRSCRSRC